MDPVWNPNDAKQVESIAGRVLQKILPDELCYQPKHYQTKYQNPFVDGGATDDVRKNWEQFVWQDAPFCFHVRLNLKRNSRDVHSEAKSAESVIKAIVGI